MATARSPADVTAARQLLGSAAWTWGFGLLVAVLILAWSVPKITYALTHVTTDDAYIDAVPIVVSAQIVGTVEVVNVAPGERVRAGQVLAKMDPQDEAAALRAASAAVAVARAKLNQARFDAAYARETKSAGVVSAVSTAESAKAMTSSYAAQASSVAQMVSSDEAAIEDQRDLVRAAQDEIPAANQAYQNARANMKRMLELGNQGYVSAVTVENARNDLARTTATLFEARSAEARAESGMRESEAKLRSDRRAVSEYALQSEAQRYGIAAGQAQAELAGSQNFIASKDAAAATAVAELRAANEDYQTATHRLQQTTLISPQEAFVASIIASPGQALTPGSPAFELMPERGLYVTANFKETQVEPIRIGAPADVHVDAYPDVRFTGRVVDFGAASQSALSLSPNAQVPGNFVKIVQHIPIRVVLDDTENVRKHPLRAGMNVEVSVLKR